MMFFLDVWKAASNSGDHANLRRGLKNGLKGAIVSRSCAKFVTWLTRPNQLLTSVVDAGGGGGGESP